MHYKNKRILFILKERSYFPSYGLVNSCKFILNILEKEYKINCKLVTVIDNNGVDKVVHEYKPTHVIIEALWVTSPKFLELAKLHPYIEWIVRLHSKAPFISTEGIATEWIKKYYEIKNQGVKISVAANNKFFAEDLSIALQEKILYMPNIYAPEEHLSPSVPLAGLNIGCFGAVRLLKNQYEQAIAAIIFANELGESMTFHMNNGIETKDSAITKNIISLFENTPHQLVLHSWLDHKGFIDLVKTMTLGMCVSFSESFCIVAADFANNDIPVIGSEEIYWLAPEYKTNTTNTKDIVEKLFFAYNKLKEEEKYGEQVFQHINKRRLHEYNKESSKVWTEWIKN